MARLSMIRGGGFTGWPIDPTAWSGMTVIANQSMQCSVVFQLEAPRCAGEIDWDRWCKPFLNDSTVIKHWATQLLFQSSTGGMLAHLSLPATTRHGRDSEFLKRQSDPAHCPSRSTLRKAGDAVQFGP